MIRLLVRFLERVAPGIAGRLEAPGVRGARSRPVGGGVLWSAAERAPRALVVYLTPRPASARWLAGSLATRLDALVLVVDGVDPLDAVAAVVTAAQDESVGDGTLPDGSPVAVVGEGTAAPIAVSVSRLLGSRLALLYPASFDADVATGVPTTLIQASATGSERGRIVTLETALRSTGVAVRETEYAGVDDGWASRPRSARGATRALTDLVGFLDRGVGQASTFDVIPGWDLH